MKRGAGLLVALLLAGCGYSTGSLLPEGVEGIAVETFGNETFFREIEFGLTRELQAQFRKRTVYRLTTARDADAVLRGRITEVRLPVIIETQEDLVSEQAVIVTAEVEMVDPRTGRILEAFVLRNRAEYVVERGETRETAFDEALRDLAEDIVNRLQAGSFRPASGEATR